MYSEDNKHMKREAIKNKRPGKFFKRLSISQNNPETMNSIDQPVIIRLKKNIIK